MRTYAPTPRVPTPEPFSSPVKPGSPSTESMISLSPPPSPQEPHRLGVDLRLTQEEAERKDDPNRYRYSVQLLDSKGRMVGKNGDLEGESSNWAATWMDVKPEQLRCVLTSRCLHLAASTDKLALFSTAEIDWPSPSLSSSGSSETASTETPRPPLHHGSSSQRSPQSTTSRPSSRTRSRRKSRD